MFSGLPPKADLNPSSRHVAQVPEPAVSNRSRTASLLDHLVGAGDQRRWHLQTERLCSLKIDHQLVFGRRLHRKVSRLLALENAIDVTGAEPTQLEDVRPVGNQAT